MVIIHRNISKLQNQLRNLKAFIGVFRSFPKGKLLAGWASSDAVDFVWSAAHRIGIAGTTSHSDSARM